jgi:hypothetical protein
MKDDLVTLLCQKFFQFVTPKPGDPLPGQLVTAHTVYPTPQPWILKVHSYDAADPSRSRYELKKFADGDRSHFPVAELDLRKDENLYVCKGKERPQIVVGSVRSEWANALHPDKIFLCAPLFSFKEKHTGTFKIRCAAFEYPTLFYLPSDPDGCTFEGAARLEYIQRVAGQAMHNYLSGMPRRPVALSDEALALFLNHLGRFIFHRDFDPVICEQMDAYRDLVREELRKRGNA